jgi:nickel superoxide dismutase
LGNDWDEEEGRTGQMNRNMVKLGLAGLALFTLAGVSTLLAHCQIPCGIYDDEVRLKLLEEHTATIEKSMNQITTLGAAAKPDRNQLIRWVMNKDQHADELSHIVTYYFMAQRVKPADPADAAAYEAYVTKVTLLHRMLVRAMKAKQTTDLEHVAALRKLIAEFRTAYGAK